MIKLLKYVRVNSCQNYSITEFLSQAGPHVLYAKHSNALEWDCGHKARSNERSI